MGLNCRMRKSADVRLRGVLERTGMEEGDGPADVCGGGKIFLARR